MTTHDALTKLSESAEYHILRVRELEAENRQLKNALARAESEASGACEAAKQLKAALESAEPYWLLGNPELVRECQMAIEGLAEDDIHDYADGIWPP